MLDRIFLGFSLFLFISLKVGAQNQFSELPIQFLQLEESFPILNPSYAAVDSGLTITNGNRMNFGPFKVFRTHYINASLRLPRNESAAAKHHGIGLSVIADKDGEFIQHNRLYLNYAYQVNLIRNLNLAAGFALGGLNTSIESSSISPPGSGFAPDGNIGLWLSDAQNHLGISINQAFNSKITPINQRYRLLRHLVLNGGRTFNLGPYLQLTSLAAVRITKGYDTDIDFMNYLLIQNIVAAGFNYRHHQGLALMAGFKNLPFKGGNHLAGGWFSYNVPFGKYVASSLQTYEITLSYKIK